MRLCLLRAFSACTSAATSPSRAGAFAGEELAEEEDEILEEFRFEDPDIRLSNLKLGALFRNVALLRIKSDAVVIVSKRLTIGLICVGYCILLLICCTFVGRRSVLWFAPKGQTTRKDLQSKRWHIRSQ